MPNEPILVHACCAPCLCGWLDRLHGRGSAPTVLFHNPNIHPLIEFRRRLKACHVLAEREGFPFVAHDTYGLEEFLDATDTKRTRPERCRACYRLRLDAAARHASEHGFPAFTSTLLVSPQQDRAAICEIGHDAARRHGVAFDDADCRDFHNLGLERARSLQLYRQQYCGCIFSECERFRDTTRHLVRPQQPLPPAQARGAER